MLVRGPAKPVELANTRELFAEFQSGDCLVLNETRVLRHRVFTEAGLEILFLEALNDERTRWSVLCPSSRWKPGTQQILSRGIALDLVARGRTQVVQAEQPLSAEYFESCGEMPLPPYIQKARGERHNRADDSSQYQTAWAKNQGSLAAPTASLHFTKSDLERLKDRGVRIVKLTLHVGLGTFLPVNVESLDEHVMHAENVTIPADTWRAVSECSGRVWALGTTVARSLESAAAGMLKLEANGDYSGATALFIRPGFTWKVVDVLMTNFHQPRSTLLALVAAFAGLEHVKECYAWAIERHFRLFSYGDLTVWTK
jgi:S-adenosylmethionine:tRNA ribosyltransferase-isomerase